MGFVKRSDFIPSRIAEKIRKTMIFNNKGEAVQDETSRKKVSLTEIITSDFSEVRLFSTWEGLVRDWLQYKCSLLENKWFIDVIFGLPKWASFNDFTLAIETIVKMETMWQDSEWFYLEIFEKYKPTKNLAAKKLSLCHECDKDVFLIKVLNKESKQIEEIKVNSKLFTVTFQNREMIVISQLGEVTTLKNVGTGYQLHTVTCTARNKKPISYLHSKK